MDVADWIAVAVFVYAMLLQLREKRRLRETVAQVERQQGRSAALRVEAQYALWNDAKIDRIAEEIGGLESIESADRFRAEAEAARAGTPFYSRPVRYRWAIPIGLSGVLAIIAVIALLYP